MSDELETRVERLETGQSSIIGKLDELLASGHEKAQAHTERRLDRPSTVEEQVRAELKRSEDERRAAADKDAEVSERESIRQQLAALAEKPPEQPQPRRTRLMWGKP